MGGGQIGCEGYLHPLNLPLPPEQTKLESIVQTVLTRASAFICANAVGLIKGFTYFFFDLILVLFITFFMFLQGDDFIKLGSNSSPLWSPPTTRKSSRDRAHHQATI
jgi:predicted PurR-regulated permease PerM